MTNHYFCHGEFTAQQREDDSDHGIMENQTRFLDLADNGTFTFKYHYYYEYENVYYVMETQDSNDTTFKGNFVKEGNSLTLTITGGEQDSKDQVKKKTVFSTKKIEGKINLIQDGEVLKVAAVQLKPEKLDRIKSILRVNQVFKKVKN